jgi:hypothetical protein
LKKNPPLSASPMVEAEGEFVIYWFRDKGIWLGKVTDEEAIISICTYIAV